ncbi:MAG TPA: hypothetical protein GXZ97_02865 [Hydrogenispora sp.]|nr:hypothetical protein [Hydrogenispora sp.]
MVKEHYLLGLVSGACGGLASTVVNLAFILLFKVGNLRFIDFAGVFILGHPPENLGENLLSFFAFLGFSATLGVLFTYLSAIPPRPYLLVKAIHFGLGIWFFSYALTLLFKVPEFTRISLASALTNLLASAAYGLVLGLVLRYLLRKAAATNQ